MNKIVTSKIKEMFPDDLLRMICAVCDTRRIESNKQKMLTVYGLLNEWNIAYEPLGDATNRLAIQKDAYAFKIALDEAGYKDNLMEYSVSQELQPFVTHTYETNGYIAVAECVKSLSEEDFLNRRDELSKTLDIIGSEYLLGDVGITKKNYKNWGVRDSGELVILDYAYVHRATEELFLCSRCGGMLHYNEAFTHLQCLDRGGCSERYSYDQKRAQIPDSEIIKVIDEAKSKSIQMTQARLEFTDINGKQVDINTNAIIIKSEKDYQRYLKEVNAVCTNYDTSIDELVEVALAAREGKDPKPLMEKVLKESIPQDEKEVIIASVPVDPDDEQSERRPVVETPLDDDDYVHPQYEDDDDDISFEELIEMALCHRQQELGNREANTPSCAEPVTTTQKQPLFDANGYIPEPVVIPTETNPDEVIVATKETTEQIVIPKTVAENLMTSPKNKHIIIRANTNK